MSTPDEDRTLLPFPGVEGAYIETTPGPDAGVTWVEIDDGIFIEVIDSDDKL